MNKVIKRYGYRIDLNSEYELEQKIEGDIYTLWKKDLLNFSRYRLNWEFDMSSNTDWYLRSTTHNGFMIRFDPNELNQPTEHMFERINYFTNEIKK